MFKQNCVYIVQTSKFNFVGMFSGINEVAKPFLQFHQVTLIDDGKHTHFLKTGKIEHRDFKGAYSFNGFWIRDNWIISAIEVATEKKPDLKAVESPQGAVESIEPEK